MAKTMLYIHGNGGSPAEAERFRPLCPGWSVAGVGYCGAYPWTAKPAIEAAFLSALSSGPAAVIANSIGAYYAMCALQGMPVEKALFISPVLDMEELIRRMMLRAGGKHAFAGTHPRRYCTPKTTNSFPVPASSASAPGTALRSPSCPVGSTGSTQTISLLSSTPGCAGTYSSPLPGYALQRAGLIYISGAAGAQEIQRRA